MFRLLVLLLITLPIPGKDSYLFTSFHSNGETGLFLSLSSDGQHWSPLNGNRPWLKPEIKDMLMRDPWLGKGPDGVWHLLWTCSWTRTKDGKLVIGHSSSKDLVSWAPQEEIEVLRDSPTAKNAWAPEAVWDEAQNQWIIFWASTIPGEFPEVQSSGDKGYNHRIYAMTTHDWRNFTPSKLWFDPGFNCIDSTVVQDGKRWVMIFKDERLNPMEKRLRLAFADSPEGPWRDISDPFSGDWVEGPTAIRLDSGWWIYFDHYRTPQHYGAMRTTDWKTFQDATDQVSFPAGQRHGTVVRIDEDLAGRLKLQQR